MMGEFKTVMIGMYGILEIHNAAASGIYFHLLDAKNKLELGKFESSRL
jgi:hypothetical protein